MRERTKFVVPLTIPSTRCTFETTSDSRSTLMTGIAAQTDASKRSCTPAADAIANSSAPWRATSCLFAVTTDLPARSSSRTYSPAGSRPPITSATTSTAGSSRTSAKSVVSTPSPAGNGALLRRVADERAHDAQPVPGRALDLVGALDEQPVDRRRRPCRSRGGRRGRQLTPWASGAESGLRCPASSRSSLPTFSISAARFAALLRAAPRTSAAPRRRRRTAPSRTRRCGSPRGCGASRRACRRRRRAVRARGRRTRRRPRSE